MIQPCARLEFNSPRSGVDMARGVVETGRSLKELTDLLMQQEAHLRAGGGAAGHERQRRLGRLPVRERLALLLDDAGEGGEETARPPDKERERGRSSSSARLPLSPSPILPLSSCATWLELGLWAAHGMYTEWGEVPAAGVVMGIGTVTG